MVKKPFLNLFCTFLIGVLQKHNDDGSKQAIIGIPYPVVFLVKAPPHPLKPKLAPLPPAYYDPQPPLPPSEPQPPQPSPWDNLDYGFGMPIDKKEEKNQFQIRPDSDIVTQQRQDEGFSDYYDDDKNSRFDSGYQQNSQRKQLVCCLLLFIE